MRDVSKPLLRSTLAAVTLSLVAACGGGSDGASTAADSSKQGGKGTKVLGLVETRSILPDATALPGWKPQLTPMVMSAAQAKKQKLVGWCLKRPQDPCAGARFTGSSTFMKPRVVRSGTVFVITFPDEQKAQASYTEQTKSVPRTMGGAQKLDVGAIGDSRAAWIGTGARFYEKSAAQVLVREGTVVLGVILDTASDQPIDEGLVKDFSKAVTERAEQVQAGERATAGL